MKKEVKYAIVGVSLAAFAGLAWYLINRKTCSSYTNEDDCRLNHCHWWNETCQSWNAQLPWTYPCLNFDSLDFCREGDGLRLDSVSMVGENEYDISRPYSFLMTDVQGKDLFFHYNTTSDLFANPWHETPYQMLYTYDGINWERIPDCEYNAGVYSFWITPTQNTIRISNFFAKDYAPIQYMMYSKQNSPYVRISNVSHSNDCPPSVPKMDIAMMEITNFSIPESQKVHAVCICRQHPYETYPSFTLEGCIDSILMDSKYRDYIHWYFIPCMNPRGVYYTIQRHNAPGTCGVDINRSWDKNPGEDGYAIETDLVKTKLIEINNRYGIDFFFDMHSQPVVVIHML